MKKIINEGRLVGFENQPAGVRIHEDPRNSEIWFLSIPYLGVKALALCRKDITQPVELVGYVVRLLNNRQNGITRVINKLLSAPELPPSTAG